MATFELISDNPSRRGDSVDDWRVELDDAYSKMRQFPSMEPDEILVLLSGFSSRASEIRSRLVRSESRRAAYFRTQEITPFLDCCELQFKIFSRLIAFKSLDWDMAKGQA